MDLDFKALDGLSGAERDFASGPEQTAPTLEREAQREADARQRAAAVYRTYQENIKATELLQAEILKGIKAHEDIYTLFLKASKALSLTISNREFYKQIERELPIYHQEAQRN